MVAGLFWLGATANAGEPLKLTGSIVGMVSDVRGIPQMGATVLLYNRYDRLVQRALTNEKGAFGFDALLSDTYSLRVSLNSFVPALKRNIAVQPGMRSFLEINLAGVLSSIELVYSGPAQSALMSDDWKWVLRSSLATRPVMRIVPGIDISNPSERREASVLSDTRGIFKVSAGDQDSSAAFGNQPDLGTAFALATSLFGTHQLQLSGNVGYATSGLPTAGFRTTFSRTAADRTSTFANPEVQLTMRQVFLPVRAGGAFLGGDAASRSAPALRTMTAAVHDKAALSEDITLEYGFSLDSITFVDRLNYFSPYGRLTYSLGNAGSLRFAYSSGAPPAELVLDGEAIETELQQDLATLSLFPRISLRDGSARVQRSENFEVGFTKVIASRTFNVSIFREAVANAALTMTGANGLVPAGDLLPDIASNSSIFNVGNFHSNGYAASVTQSVNDHWNVTLGFGNGGVLRTEQRELQSGSPDELRAMVRMSQRNWASARVSGVYPVTGTALSGSYLWTDYRSLTPAHAFLTQSLTPQAGLNVSVRQPIPIFSGIPGRLEATAELRNLLAQGYLPVQSVGGRRLLLIHSPRAVRGGLSFIF
jgi:hypothetical protein